MICEKCGEAGDLWAQYRKDTQPAVRAFVQGKVRNLHEACLYPSSCDCLHRLGPPPNLKGV